jgi:PHD/YefM family antitoxin component YafN of YafNO toxin-antitoxin module
MMNIVDNVQPISYLKRNAADVVKQLNTAREPVMITVNGKISMVLQDPITYQKKEDTMAMLQILAVGQKQIAEGKTSSFADVKARLAKA